MNAIALPQSMRPIFEEFEKRFEGLPSVGRLSDAEVEAIYAIAYRDYHLGMYERALNHFLALLVYRPTRPVYLLGTALCLQRLRKYELAQAAYMTLAYLEPDAPRHTLAIAECMLLRHDHTPALAILDEVVRFCERTPGHEPVRARAQAMIELMRSHDEPVAA